MRLRILLSVAWGTGDTTAVVLRGGSGVWNSWAAWPLLVIAFSPAQRNDWPWFKDAWDEAMVAEHRTNWAAVFSGWVQHVLDDERSNAFSTFVFNETCRVLSGSAA